MFKITLRLLILLLIVAGSVSSLKCNQMDVSTCNRDGNLTTLAVCLKSHIKSVQCESPKGCLEDNFSAGSRLSVLLLGCGLKNNCKEDLYQPLLGTSGSQWADELTQDSCSFCDDHDGCNDGTRTKELKGPIKNSTTAPKKSGGIRSSRMTRIHQTSILLHILLLLFPFF